MTWEWYNSWASTMHELNRIHNGKSENLESFTSSKQMGISQKTERG